MYEIVIVGDVHICMDVPSRLDNYLDSVLAKIDEISNKAKNVIFLGDLFNQPVVPYNCYSKVWNLLSYHSSTRGVKYYSIIGNHDIPNELETEINKTALGLLAEQDAITLITTEQPVEIEGRRFFTGPVNFKRCKEYLRNNIGCFRKDDFLLLHQYYEDDFECLTYEDLKDLGCSNIFLGHHHKPFDGLRKVYPNMTIYRCGSLGRNKAEDFNFTRDVYYYYIDSEVHCATIECLKQATEVFKPDALNHTNLRKREFVKGINDIIAKYSNNISTENKFSIKTILQELNTPVDCMSYISSIYNKHNERFE